jgi:hypothetical protein
MKFQAANSMAKLAEQGGGGPAGGAMGMGMGAGFGMMMPGMIQQAMGGTAGPGGGMARPQAPAPGGPAGGGAAAGAVAGAAVGMGAAAAGPDFADLAPVTTDPKSMVRNVAEAAGYTLTESGNTIRVTVPIGSTRKQLVSIDFGQTDDSGHSMVNYWSIGGPISEKNAMSLLRYNTKMLHGAFAARTIDGAEMVVIQANQLAETLDPLEVSRVLSAVAWQADQVEQKLVGGDEY